jgi:hypothetical protein
MDQHADLDKDSRLAPEQASAVEARGKGRQLTQDLHRGSCLMGNGATMWIYSDGRLTFSARVRTEGSSHDVWHQGFAFYDGNNMFIARMGYYDQRLDPVSHDLYYNISDYADVIRDNYDRIDIMKTGWLCSC